MKTVSVTDLKLIPELSHLRMLDFIDPKNDELIAPYLHMLGIDLDYPIHYIASQHRNLQGKVTIAYQIAGEVRCNHEFLHSPFATVEDRIIAAGYRDLSLAEEMSASLGSSRSYDGEDAKAGAMEVLSPDMVNPDEADILMQINVLENLLLEVRGSPYKADGARKTIWEYHTTEEPVKRRKRAVKASSEASNS